METEIGIEIGKRFGRLTVVEFSHKTPKYEKFWRCKCDCGNEKVTRGSSLKNGICRSCGCLSIETASRRLKKLNTKHGYFGTTLYNRWHNIKDRCNNPKCSQYKNYGARGIRLCKEWENNPKAFCEWALKNGFKEGLTIDRIDVNGDYEPSNCRWITRDEQQTNKRNNVLVTYKGKTQCVAEWSRELQVPKFPMYWRIEHGWENPEEIFYGRKRG